ncbi:response regulator transcription factor [Sphingobacterium pedocola]|uniref:DNA-binding response regulator n=1 Tax=Sphingobacterium pedocola TaxID=2082722 RepID=A0ABR9T336_9SPHI|nr:response regulator transcription factor [Sphingobacterium pedocola]MBE8719759.1 DNA-binding response regulator [Sphingobacterium pedocola]
MKNRLLFVEDEIDLGMLTKQYLEISGLDIVWYKNAENALEAYTLNPDFALALIDITLPGMDGFSLVQEMLSINHNQSFLFLTARNNKEDRLTGLKIGADDYISKPFDIEELLLRIKNILKRQGGITTVQDFMLIGDITFFKDALKLVFPNGDQVSLTAREAELWSLFVQHSNVMLTREQILINIWGENDYFLGRSLDVFISRIRKLLQYSTQVKLSTVYGKGFILQVTS